MGARTVQKGRDQLCGPGRAVDVPVLRRAGPWACLAHGASAENLPTWCDAGVQIVWHVIDLLPQAVFLVDRRGRFHRANRAGERLLHAGGPFQVSDGRLTCREGTTPRLHDAIALGAVDGSYATLLAPDKVALPLATLAVNLGSAEDPNAPIAVVCQSMATRRKPSAKTIAAAYGLTLAEAQVTALLTEGRSPQDIAKQLGRGLATIRTHLRQIYAKTRTAGQAELVQLVLTGPGIMGGLTAAPRNRIFSGSNPYGR